MHVAPPLLQDRAASLAGLKAGNAGNTRIAGSRYSPSVSLANTSLNQPSTSSSYSWNSCRMECLYSLLLLHSLLDELLEDGGDGLRADALQ